MSATMINVPEVARWLDAALYRTTWRPVQLRQLVKVPSQRPGDKAQLVAIPEDMPCLSLEELLQRTPERRALPALSDDADHLAWLAKETIDEGGAVLVFCGTKGYCRTVAQDMQKVLRDPLPVRSGAAPPPPGCDRASLQAELRALMGQTGASPVLADLVELVGHGLAFHNSDLGSKERAVVERGFRQGTISVLTATSTLAAGVNLPARRVIFAHPWVASTRTLLNAASYRQMSGRAGRAGLDSVGESILVLPRPNLPNDRSYERMSGALIDQLFAGIFNPDLLVIKSRLGAADKGMQRALMVRPHAFY